jgi:hypothetical protein
LKKYEISLEEKDKIYKTKFFGKKARKVIVKKNLKRSSNTGLEDRVY